MDIAVREAIPDDAEAIIGVFNPIIEAGRYTVFDTPFSVEEERRFIQNLSARGILHVASLRDDPKIIGFQVLEPFATFTRAFDHVGVLATYVDLERRRSGIGSALFEATFAAARRRGYEKLFTYVRADNAAALSAYRKQGFQVIGIARGQAKIQGRYVDEVIIECFL